MVQNKDALTKFQNKFCGKLAVSSQLNQKKGLKTIDLFERTKSQTYTLPQSRKWTMSEAIPPPVYVNLRKVANINNQSKKKTTTVNSPSNKHSVNKSAALRQSMTKEHELQVEITTEKGTQPPVYGDHSASMKSSACSPLGSDRNTIDDLFRRTSNPNSRKATITEHSLNREGLPEVQRVKVIVQNRLGQLNQIIE